MREKLAATHTAIDEKDKALSAGVLELKTAEELFETLQKDAATTAVKGRADFIACQVAAYERDKKRALDEELARMKEELQSKDSDFQEMYKTAKAKAHELEVRKWDKTHR
jgi:chaperonin cofactor prefoldin